MTPMEAATKACSALATEAERRAFLEGYGHGIRTESATWKSALAAATGTAETNEDLAQCEASQSDGEAVTPKTPLNSPITARSSEG